MKVRGFRIEPGEARGRCWRPARVSPRRWWTVRGGVPGDKRLVSVDSPDDIWQSVLSIRYVANLTTEERAGIAREMHSEKRHHEGTIRSVAHEPVRRFNHPCPCHVPTDTVRCSWTKETRCHFRCS